MSVPSERPSQPRTTRRRGERQVTRPLDDRCIRVAGRRSEPGQERELVEFIEEGRHVGELRRQAVEHRASGESAGRVVARGRDPRVAVAVAPHELASKVAPRRSENEPRMRVKTSAFAATSPRALHRTRTDDPFLTIRQISLAKRSGQLESSAWRLGADTRSC
jgi:hypothetical protein